MFTRQIFIGGLIFWLLSQGGHVVAETTAEYVPLADGNFWTYQVTGTEGAYEKTVSVLPGTVPINGVPTKALLTSGGPEDQGKEYWTNDINGIRVHGAYLPDADPGPAIVPAWLYFEPPMVTANSTMSINETVTSSGLARFDFTDYGTFYLYYSSSYTLEGVDTVVVPAGTYETVRMRGERRIYGDILGTPYDDPSTGTTWSAKHVGVVKDIYKDNVRDELYELTSTNVKPPAGWLPFLPLLLD